MSRNFIIVGAGGIGSHLAEPLARMLEYNKNIPQDSNLIIVDGDSFEDKNAERQSFEQLGNKAEVLAKSLSHICNKINVLPIPAWVTTRENVDIAQDEEVPEGQTNAKITVDELISEGDVVYAVVDNHACRAIILQQARNLDNVDILIGGNDEDLEGYFYHYKRRDGKDITANLCDYKPEFINPTDRNPADLSCAERAKLEGGTQTIAANLGVASMLLTKTQTAIIEDVTCNKPDPATGEVKEVTQDEICEIYADFRSVTFASYDRRREVFKAKTV